MMPLRDTLAAYLALRRSVGFKLDMAGRFCQVLWTTSGGDTLG